jgi:ketosteroid isomerase-like protein
LKQPTVQATVDAAVVRELEAIEGRLAETWKNRDCAGWASLLADDWTVTHIDARTLTKAEALEMCRTGPSVSSTVDQLAVRSYGETAIVTGRTKATVSGTQEAVTLRFTDVFVRRGGRWVVVASHATRVGD